MNWLQMVSCPDIEFEELHDELRSCHGRYIFDNVQMPDTCGNTNCTIEFIYYGEDRISMLCVEAPINYTGSNDDIRHWLECGLVEFESFDELKGFLKSFVNDRRVENDPDFSPAPIVRNPSIPSSDERTAPPEMIYDRDSITIPDTDASYLVIDRDKLALDLGKEIFGQDEQIRKISHLVCNHLGTKGKQRPLSIFLYGATGIGKSAVIEALVNAINEQVDENRRFAHQIIDGTHFQEHHDISRLIGSPPGYVGHDEPGVFAILEDNPNTIFVIDEIEKAASNVTETIMEAMNSGRMATNGKTLRNGQNFYDLTQSILFFTSNIVLENKRPLGFATSSEPEPVIEQNSDNVSVARRISKETKEAKFKLAETGQFRQEVIGRMNAIIKFNNLTGEAIKDIAAKCIRDLAAKSHKLYITKLDTPILQEFINETAHEIMKFGVRSLNNEAANFFSVPMMEYSHTHADYSHITVSGTLDDVVISPSDTE